MGEGDLKDLHRRVTVARTALVNEYPFFGRLLLRLRFGFADCGTAYTDMERIVFDPKFALELKKPELEFVLLHEVMHCVLKHCVRGKGLVGSVYNIACDIVVNSAILEIMGIDSYRVAGEEVMHFAPDGTEGRLHSAEEIYEMLKKLAEEELRHRYGNKSFDKHDVWAELERGILGDRWEEHIKEAAKVCGTGTGIPETLIRYLGQAKKNPTTNWRQLLHDYIQYDRSDYLFEKPDNRYGGDFYLPSFSENADGAKVEKLWFLIDTSGSVSDEELSQAYTEISSAIEQIGNLSGMLSFFDAGVSNPIPFENVEELRDIMPIGGGGTSFKAIFRKLRTLKEEEKPYLILIITDGYASFPEETEAMGIPVIWLINNVSITPPWGEIVYI